jgi:hypothetical protein
MTLYERVVVLRMITLKPFRLIWLTRSFSTPVPAARRSLCTRLIPIPKVRGIDPGIMLHLLRHGTDLDSLEQTLKRSGLAGFLAFRATPRYLSQDPRAG